MTIRYNTRSLIERTAPEVAQRGFVLAEVMISSVAMLVILFAMMSFFTLQAKRASELVLKQQAMFVANAEMERVTALYNYTTFGGTGPLLTTGYLDNPALPASRYVYPTTLSNWMSNGGPNVMNGSGPFSGQLFLVLSVTGATSPLNRTYVWIDQGRNIIGRLSWAATDIVVASCGDGGDCKCADYAGGASNHCRKIDLFLEYPYRLSSGGTITPPATLNTITLSTIVGGGE